ncbi:MAG: hypothetical protein HYS13_19795 [Planctomycetia bacterium]|nr:hypothetical protein [Planctomycetia bacterium]
MTTMTPPPPAPLAPAITGALSRLRNRIRGYVWVEGLALAVAWLGLAFWLSLAIDWLPVKLGAYDEPSRPWRIVILAAAVVIFFGLVAWMVLRRSFVALPNRTMAVILERRFRDFNDALMTTVEMTEMPEHAAEFNPDMLAYTYAQAEERSATVPVTAVFNPVPLIRNLAIAALLLLSIGVFGLAAPHALGIWASRYLALSQTTWPRASHIAVDGPKVRKIAKGDDATITVQAATSHVVPKAVRISYWSDGGASGRENMVRQGTARDGFQLFTYTFRGRLEGLTFDAVGGDHRVRDYRIQVVDSPTAELTLYCEFPPYMVDEQNNINTPREIAGTGIVQLPLGTKVTVRAKANKPLLDAQVTYPNDKGEDQHTTLNFNPPSDRFEFVISSLNIDSTLLFLLHDVDDIRSREPIRLSLVAQPDEIPQVEMRLRGISDAVTAEVRIPAEGQITDDHGVIKTWFAYAIDDEDPRNVPFRLAPKGRTELVFARGNDEEALDIREEVRARNAALRQAEPGKPGENPPPGASKPEEGQAEDCQAGGAQPPPAAKPPEGGPMELVLKPGQRLVVIMQAQDACSLGDKPRIGASRRYELRVVTPEELRGLLAGREINLRARFERILEEVTATRDSLTEVTLRPEDLRGGKLPVLPGDPDAGKPVTPERLRALGHLRTQRCQQNSLKNSGETMEIALQFDDIRDELLNNRLYTEEYEKRLKDGISDPLKEIAGPMFAELDKRLLALEGLLSDTSTADHATRAAALLAAQEQSDAIIVKMHEVLGKMLEMEAFNRAVELLREIVERQKRLNDKTKQHQLENLNR